MKKKVFLISFIMVILLSTFICIYVFTKKDNKIKLDTTITSSIVLDINPSLKIELNKENKVINLIGLNEDGKKVIIDDYKGKIFEEVIENILEKSRSLEYLKDDTTILVSVDGTYKADDLKTIISEHLENKNIKGEVIIPTITESSKEIASKYNITESKASYLEEIIKDTSFKIEDVKDMSVQDAKEKVQEEIKKQEEIKQEEIKQEQNKNNTTNNNNSSNNNTNKNNNNSNSGSSSLTPPVSSRDTSGAWCTFNKNRPYNYVYDYKELIGEAKVREIATNHLAGVYFKTSSLAIYDDIKGSYCKTYKFAGLNDDFKYYLTIDSVTGSILEESKEEMEKPSISKDKAKEIGLTYFKLQESECELVQADLSSTFTVLKYTFIARCNGTYYTADIDGKTGSLSGNRTWQN